MNNLSLKKNDMKISVILPCFNGASTIDIQMEALCRQSWPGAWEVIVSNNGSTDDSIAIVEQYRSRLPELKIVNAYNPPETRLGAYRSYNVGLAAATGDAFLLCEADDEVGDGWLEAMGNALIEHEFVAARIDYQKLNPDWLLKPLGEGLQEAEIARIKCYPYFQFAWGCTFGFRRSVYEKLGEFNPSFNYVFDADYCCRAQLAGIPIQLVPDAVVHYRLRDTLKGLFKQKVKWGEEFKILIQCYGAPAGKFRWIRSRLRVINFSLMSIVLLPSDWLRIPGSRKHLFTAVENLAWSIGELRSQSQPLPFKISPSTKLEVEG
jgi:glycosyltransferase involved in cell wall biosynthesis